MPSSTSSISSPYEATHPRPGHSPGLERAVAVLVRSRVVLWTIVVLEGISLLRNWHLTRMGWEGIASIVALVVSVLLLLAYNDAIAQFRANRNQHNLERLFKSHAFVWATLAVSTLFSL